MKGKKALCCHICFIVQVLRVWGSFIACFWAGQHHDLAAVPRALDQPYIRLSPKIQWPYTKMLSEYLQLSIGLLLHYLTFSFLVVNSERWQEASNQICRSVQKNIQRAKCYSHSHIKYIYNTRKIHPSASLKVKTDHILWIHCDPEPNWYTYVSPHDASPHIPLSVLKT